MSKHKQELEVVAKELLEKEIIFQADLERLIGKRPFEHQTSYEAFTNSNEEVKKEEIVVDENTPSEVNETSEEVHESQPPSDAPEASKAPEDSIDPATNGVEDNVNKEEPKTDS